MPPGADAARQLIVRLVTDPNTASLALGQVDVVVDATVLAREWRRGACVEWGVAWPGWKVAELWDCPKSAETGQDGCGSTHRNVK